MSKHRLIVIITSGLFIGGCASISESPGADGGTKSDSGISVPVDGGKVEHFVSNPALCGNKKI